jgi:hypothetical protein
MINLEQKDAQILREANLETEETAEVQVENQSRDVPKLNLNPKLQASTGLDAQDVEIKK